MVSLQVERSTAGMGTQQVIVKLKRASAMVAGAYGFRPRVFTLRGIISIVWYGTAAHTDLQMPTESPALPPFPPRKKPLMPLLSTRRQLRPKLRRRKLPLLRRLLQRQKQLPRLSETPLGNKLKMPLLPPPPQPPPRRAQAMALFVASVLFLSLIGWELLLSAV